MSRRPGSGHSAVQRCGLLALRGDAFALKKAKMSTQKASRFKIPGCAAHFPAHESRGGGIPPFLSQRQNFPSRLMMWEFPPPPPLPSCETNIGEIAVALFTLHVAHAYLPPTLMAIPLGSLLAKSVDSYLSCPAGPRCGVSLR